jgi:hypothetical protein
MNNVPLGRATGAASATAAMRVIRVMLSFILTIGDAVVAGLDLIGSGERPKSITDKPGVIGGGDKGVSSLAVMAWRDFERIAEERRSQMCAYGK